MATEPFIIDPGLLFQFEVPIQQVSIDPTNMEWNLPEKCLMPVLSEGIARSMNTPLVEPMVDVRMAWSTDYFFIEAFSENREKVPKEKWFDNRVCLDFVIDTRSSHNIRRRNAFCHSFQYAPKCTYFLQLKDGVRRSAFPNQPPDTSRLLSLFRAERTDSDYRLRMAIPADELPGYSPLEFSQIGFFYRIDDPLRGAQRLSHSDVVRLFEDPSVWTRGKLVT